MLPKLCTSECPKVVFQTAKLWCPWDSDSSPGADWKVISHLTFLPCRNHYRPKHTPLTPSLPRDLGWSPDVTDPGKVQEEK